MGHPLFHKDVFSVMVDFLIIAIGGGVKVLIGVAQELPGTKTATKPSADVVVPNNRMVITSRNAGSLMPLAIFEDEGLRSIVWARNPNRLGAVGWEEPVYILDAVSLNRKETIGETKEIVGFDFSPKEDVIAYCESGKPIVTIADLRSEKVISLNTESDPAGLAFSPDGEMLATYGDDTPLRLWRAADGRLLRKYDYQPAQGVRAPAFSPDGRLLAFGNRSFTRVINVLTGEVLYILQKPWPREIRFHPKGHRIAIVYLDGSITVWRTSNMQHRTARVVLKQRNFAQWTGRLTVRC